jgi:hypothetical protein
MNDSVQVKISVRLISKTKGRHRSVPWRKNLASGGRAVMVVVFRREICAALRQRDGVATRADHPLKARQGL